MRSLWIDSKSRGKYTKDATHRRYSVVCLIAGLLALGTAAESQPAQLPTQVVVVAVDSGVVSASGTGTAPVVVFSQVVSVAGASWIRLHFQQVELSGSASIGDESFLRITSVLDGATQISGRTALTQWRNTSASFNGGDILVELLAYPNTGANRLIIDRVTAGVQGASAGGDGQLECLDTIDDRVPSQDPRASRLLSFHVPSGMVGICTAFLIDQCPNCFMSAGHCIAFADLEDPDFPPIVEFNVPLSDTDGSINHPGPEDQYCVDPLSAQFQLNTVFSGHDWCCFAAFNNSMTHLSPLTAQGTSYHLADIVPEPQPLGTMVRVTGYGLNTSLPELTATQQTDTGTYEELDGTDLRSDVDTRGGNSGSAIEDTLQQLVYGIHSVGCRQLFPPIGPLGHATAVDHPLLRFALNNPRGFGADCNENGISDPCDTSCAAVGCVQPCGTSADCDANFVPDECETILFVNSADPTQTVANGRGWLSAYRYLQDALNAARAACPPVDEIWVAGGWYTPDQGEGQVAGDRSASFQLVDGVGVYGGFAGTESNRSQRNPSLNLTVLSGDSLGNDYTPGGSTADNSYHVVTATGAGSGTVLDGFTITRGVADGVWPDNVAAGLVVGPGGAPTLAHCIFFNNSGEAVRTDSSLAPTVFTNCLFHNHPTAALVTIGAGVRLVNCTITQNYWGMDNRATGTSITNSIVWGNQAGIVNGTVPAVVSYSVVQDGYSGTGNIADDPLFVAPDGLDGLPGTDDDDLRLAPSSPAFGLGDTTALTAGTDLDGNPRVSGCTVDMGAYEIQTTPVAANPLAPTGGQATWDKNRYLSFRPNSNGERTAYRVTLVSLREPTNPPDPNDPPDFGDFDGEVRWLGAPQQVCELGGIGVVSPTNCVTAPRFWAAKLECDPVYADWSGIDIVHVYGSEVVPGIRIGTQNPPVIQGSSYEVDAIHQGCDTAVLTNYCGNRLPRLTNRWGDVVGVFQNGQWTPPDGIVNVTTDVTAVLQKFANTVTAPTKVVCDVDLLIPDLKVNISDVTKVQSAFQSMPYPCSWDPLVCPRPPSTNGECPPAQGE